MRGPPTPPEVRALAAALSESLLFPSAVAVDRADAVPVSHLDALAEAGLYGLAGPPERGGLGLPESDALAVIELLASGCLTTTFVWLQHHASVRAVAAAGGALQSEWLEPLCTGQRRAGIAFAGLRRPGPPVLSAERGRGGWVLRGFAPWVTGWDLVDVMLVGARVPSLPGTPVLWVLVDAAERDGLSVERLHLAAVNASVTVTASFDGVHVAEGRVVGVEEFGAWRRRDAGGLRTNGSLALGLAARCAHLLGGAEAEAIRLGLSDRRRALDSADADGLPAARAAAAELALEAATSLVITTGGSAVLLDSVAQMLARQAIFLLVFGQTRAIRDAQLAGRRPGPRPGSR